MAWIESHQETARHPKTRKLCRLLNISTPTAVGHLHMFWWWAMDFAPDGDVGKFDPEDIADAAGWEGDPQGLIDAFVQAGFVDETEAGRGIHDWYDYAGRLIERRQADAERKRNSRKTKPSGKPSAPDVQETSSGHPADVPGMSSVTVPNRTVPNQKDIQPIGEEPAAPTSPPPDERSRLEKLIKECDLKKANIFSLDQIISFIGAVEIGVIEAAIKKASGKHVNYALETLTGWAAEGKTRTADVMPPPSVGERRQTPRSSGRTGKPELPIVQNAPTEAAVSDDEFAEYIRMAEEMKASKGASTRA